MCMCRCVEIAKWASGRGLSVFFASDASETRRGFAECGMGCLCESAQRGGAPRLANPRPGLVCLPVVCVSSVFVAVRLRESDVIDAASDSEFSDGRLKIARQPYSSEVATMSRKTAKSSSAGPKAIAPNVSRRPYMLARLWTRFEHSLRCFSRLVSNPVGMRSLGFPSDRNSNRRAQRPHVFFRKHASASSKAGA